MIRAKVFLVVVALFLPALALGHTDDPVMPVAADPDTVIARLIFPEGMPDPVRVTFSPDTITVGSDAFLSLEFAAGQVPTDLISFADSTEFSQEWIDWDPSAPPFSPIVSGADSTQVQIPVKIYQINPFRVEVGSQSTQVVLVDFLTSGVQETAGIRDPRRWGWNLFTLLIGALILTALILLAWWAWTARKVATEKLPDWDVPVPAWLQSCQELAALHDAGIIDRGEGREYLDQLAGICRRFVTGRFRVSAVEMTSPEIALACDLRGHPSAATSCFTSLLDEIDTKRYDPQPLSPHNCRLLGKGFLAGMADVRIIPRYTPVPAAEILAAEKTWASLEENLLLASFPSQDEVYAPKPDGQGQ